MKCKTQHMDDKDASIIGRISKNIAEKAQNEKTYKH